MGSMWDTFKQKNSSAPFVASSPICLPTGIDTQNIELDNPANPSTQSVTYFYWQTNGK